MEKENIAEVTETSQQEIDSADTTETVSGEELKPFKIFYTEEDYNKELQSTSSKAKFSILQNIGEKSVDDIRGKLDNYNKLLEEKLKIEKEFNEFKESTNKEREQHLLNMLGVDENKQNDFLILAKSKITDDKSLDVVASELINLYPTFKTETIKAKVGVEKKETDTLHKKMAEIENTNLRSYFGLNK